jgi:DNA-binding beta-propeller fold protein YncE
MRSRLFLYFQKGEINVMKTARGRIRSLAGATMILATLVAAPMSAEAETLYALERNGPNLRTIDRTTGGDISTVGSTVTGGWRGMAMDPQTGVMYVTDSEYLFTIDLATGATSQIGLFGSVLVRDLSFDDQGQLYGVTGNQGSNQNSLHLISTVSGSASFLIALGGSGSHGIAYDPAELDALYHLSRNGVFERVDLTNLFVTPIGTSGDPIIGRPLGFVYDPIDDVFRFFDDTGRYYFEERDGTVTATGTSNPTQYFGLAFDQETTRVVLFRDGFESGDTTAWSNTVP